MKKEKKEQCDFDVDIERSDRYLHVPNCLPKLASNIEDKKQKVPQGQRV